MVPAGAKGFAVARTIPDAKYMEATNRQLPSLASPSRPSAHGGGVLGRKRSRASARRPVITFAEELYKLLPFTAETIEHAVTTTVGLDEPGSPQT
jgi:hypothetical protein